MIRINLLPREEKPSRTVLIWRSVFIWTLIAAAVVVVAGIGLHMFRSYEIRTLEADIEQTRAEQDKYREQAKLVNALTEKRREITQRIDVIESLDKDRYLRVYLLDELARSVPDYIWLQRFNENGGGVMVKGWAFSNLAVSRFMDSLEAKAHTDSVFLRVIRKEEIQGTPVLGFEVGYQIRTFEEEAESS
jgi:type IV pilus assembly protein PilN